MEIKIKAEHQAASDAAVAHTGMDEQSYWQAYVDARGAEMTAGSESYQVCQLEGED